MPWYEFGLHLIAAFVFGALVGAERQWRQRTAGLRTNCLVAVGAAMFVMMGGLIGGSDGSQGRVAAYVVSGIGFIGGGVILKEGFSIRGLNTAATLWCTAAIGTLAGLGYTRLSLLGTVAVLMANISLRPLAQRINRSPSVPASEEVISYLFECVCRTSDEAHVRAQLLQHVRRTELLLYELHSTDEEGDRVKVQARLKSVGRKDELLEEIVSRLSLEPGVTTIRWQIVSALDSTEDVIGPATADDHL